jgi:hypothetical protein
MPAKKKTKKAKKAEKEVTGKKSKAVAGRRR